MSVPQEIVRRFLDTGQSIFILDAPNCPYPLYIEAACGTQLNVIEVYLSIEDPDDGIVKEFMIMEPLPRSRTVSLGCEFDNLSLTAHDIVRQLFAMDEKTVTFESLDQT